MMRLDYIPCADPGFLFREKEERDIRVCRGEGGPRYISQIKFKKFAFSRVTHLLDSRIHAIFYIILYDLFIGIYIIIHSLDI